MKEAIIFGGGLYYFRGWITLTGGNPVDGTHS